MSDDITQPPEDAPAPAPDAPKKRRRWPLRVLIGLILLIVVIIVAPMLPPVQEFARGKIVAAANGTLAGRLEIDHISGTVWTGVTIEGVRLFDARGNLIISAPSAKADYDLLALPGQAKLDGLTLIDPLVIARIYPDATLNFSLISHPAPPSGQPTRLPIDLDLQGIRVQNGALVYLDERPQAPDAPPDAALHERLTLASQLLAERADKLTGAERAATIVALTAPRKLSQPAPPRVAAIDGLNVEVRAAGFEDIQTAEGTLDMSANALADTWSAPLVISVEDLFARGPLVPGDFKATLAALRINPKGADTDSGVRDLAVLATLSGDPNNPLPISKLDAKIPPIRLDRALLTTVAAGLPVRSGVTVNLNALLDQQTLKLDSRLALTEAPGAVIVTASAQDLLPALINPDDPALAAKPTYKANVTIERIDPNDAWPLPFPVSAQGVIDVEGQGIEPLTAKIKATAKIVETTVDSITIDSLDLAARADEGVAHLDTLALRSPHVDLDAEGEARLNGPFELDVAVKTDEGHKPSYTLPDGSVISQRNINIKARVEGALDAMAPEPLDKLPQAALTLTADIAQLDAPGITVNQLRTYQDPSSSSAQPITASIALQPGGDRLVRWDLGLAAQRLVAPGIAVSQLDARAEGQTTLSADAVASRFSDPQSIIDALRLDLTARVGSLRAGTTSVGATRLEAHVAPSSQGVAYTILADANAIRAGSATIRRVRTTDEDNRTAPITGYVALTPGGLKSPGLSSIASVEASGPIHAEGIRAGSISVEDVLLTPKLRAAPLLNPAGTLAIRLRGLTVALQGPTPSAPDAADAARVAENAADKLAAVAEGEKAPELPPDPDDQAKIQQNPKQQRRIAIPRADGLITFAADDKSFDLRLDGDYVRPGKLVAEPVKLAGSGVLDIKGQRVKLNKMAAQLPGTLLQIGPTSLALHPDGGSVNALQLHADPVASNQDIDITQPPPAEGRIGIARVDGAVRLRGTSDLTAELVGWDLVLLRETATRLWDMPLPNVRGQIHQVIASVHGNARAPDIKLLVAADGLFYETQGPFAVAVDGELDPRGIRLKNTGVLGWGYPLLSVSADLPVQVALTRPPIIRWDAPAKLNLQVAKTELTDLREPLTQLQQLEASGTVGGHIDLTGTLARPSLDMKLLADNLSFHSHMGGRPVTIKELTACAAVCYNPPGAGPNRVCSAGCEASEQAQAGQAQAQPQSAPEGLTSSARIVWEGQPIAALEASAELPIAGWVRAFIERGVVPTPTRDILNQQFNLFLDVKNFDLAVARKRLNIPQLALHDAEGLVNLTVQGNGTLEDPSMNLQLRVGAIEDVSKDDKGRAIETRTTGGLGWDRYRDIAIAADGTLSRGVLRLTGLRLNWDAKDIFLGSVQVGSRANRLPTTSALLRRALPSDVDIAFDLELVDTPVAKLSAVDYMFAQVKGTMGARLVGSGSLQKPTVRGRAHLLGAELGRSKTTRRVVPADVCFDFKIEDHIVESSGFIQSWNTPQRPAVHALLPTPCERSMNYITENAPEALERLKQAGINDKAQLLTRIAEDGTRDLFEFLVDARVYSNIIAIAQGADPMRIPDGSRRPIPPRREFSQRVAAQIASVRSGKVEEVKPEERGRIIELLQQRLLSSAMKASDDLRVHVFTELGQKVELAELVPRWVLGNKAQDLGGSLLIDLDVQGDYKRLSPNGYMTLEDGTITLVDFGRRFDKITLRLAADDEKIALGQLSLVENKANITAKGEVRHQWMSPREMELEIKVKDFDFGSFAGTPLFVAADVKLDGKMQRQRLITEIDINNLNVRLPKSDKNLHSTTANPDILVVRPGKPLPQNSELAGIGVPIEQGAGALAALDLTARVKLANNSWVRTEFGDVNFKGDVTANMDDGLLALTGSVDTIKGGVEFLGKAFSVSPGNIRFDGTTPPNPQLQIEAVHTLERTVIADIGQPSSGEPRIIVRVTGTARKPELQLMSDPAMSETDILYVLATGKPPGSAGVGQDESALGTALQAASGALLGLLEDQLTGQVPVDVVRFQGSTSADTAGAIEVGKYITERLFVSYAHVFGAGDTEGANEFKVEYQFLPSWLIEIKYSDTNRGQFNIFWDAY